MFTLVVTHDFGIYKRGDRITQPAEIERIRESENHANVVQVPFPDMPATTAGADSATS